MYQLEILAKERVHDLRREADSERLAALARQNPGSRAGNRIAANSLVWAGKQLSSLGDQLQKEYGEVANV